MSRLRLRRRGVAVDGRRLRTFARRGLWLLFIWLAAAVVAAPLAASWAVTQTRVTDNIGISPTVFALTTSGHSELRLGIAGTVFVPRSRGPIGVIATVQGPIDAADPRKAGGDLAPYVTPEMLELYAGLFHDPGTAIRGYVDALASEFVHELVFSELVLTLVLASTCLIIALLLPERPSASRVNWLRLGGILLVAIAATSAIGTGQVLAGDTTSTSSGPYALPALEGTPAAGSTTNSPVLRLALGDLAPKIHILVTRQERRVRAFLDRADGELATSRALMAGPRQGETAVMMQSDMHCNEAMIKLQTKVWDALSNAFGPDVPALLAVTGDLTTNGTAAEHACVQSEAAIARNAPITAVTGNHESDLSATQMKSAGMTVLHGTTETLAGIGILGDGDPERTELFGPTRQRGNESEADLGRRLYDTASDQGPELVLMHEAYAVQAFLGVDDITRFLDQRGSTTERTEDHVRDLPAAAVFYGHWHRSIAPRVVWNSDGTWTLVMELNTSGGAVDSPTIGHFSTPWTPPQQEASFPVVFLDERTHLVTGYQVYSFARDGSVTILPRVEVGDPLLGPSSAKGVPPDGRQRGTEPPGLSRGSPRTRGFMCGPPGGLVCHRLTGLGVRQNRKTTEEG